MTAKTHVVKLEPGETMAERNRRDRDDRDAKAVHRVIRKSPGIAGKAKIAEEAGLSISRVERMIKLIQSGEPGLIRIDYGTTRVRGRGKVTGWFVIDRPTHHPVIGDADAHGALVEVGVRRGRLVRLAQATGIVGAEEFVAQIEERLGVQVELLTQTDLEAFESLLVEAAKEGED